MQVTVRLTQRDGDEENIWVEAVGGDLEIHLIDEKAKRSVTFKIPEGGPTPMPAKEITDKLKAALAP